MTSPSTPAELDALEERIDAWLAGQLRENPVIAAVERDRESGRAPLVRADDGRGEGRLHDLVHLRQRTLHYETYVMPAPEENHAAFYEHLLRRNRKLYGAAFASATRTPCSSSARSTTRPSTDDELDRILGSLYA